jgi:hypothetical protein
MVGGLAAAICVLAVTAAPAMAHQFVSSKLGESGGRGLNEIEIEKGVEPEYDPSRMQEWNLGASFRILCYKAKLAGQVTELESEEYTTTIHFSKCGWYPQSGKNHLHIAAYFGRSGLTVVYHANGWTETLGNGLGETFEYKNLTVRETAVTVKINSTKLCTITIPEQTFPVRPEEKSPEEFSSAVFSNGTREVLVSKAFPEGTQKTIVIANSFKRLHFKYTGETQCATGEEFEKQAEEGGGGIAGSWHGAIQTWVKGGNLDWE